MIHRILRLYIALVNIQIVIAVDKNDKEVCSGLNCSGYRGY